MRMSRFFVAGLMFFSGLAPAAAEFPSQPIKMVVPFSAGGSTDVMGRILAAGMSPDLGQQVVIENRGGAGGTIASGAVARARPDGYTIIQHTVSTAAINAALYKKLPYDVRTAFAPISLVTRIPNVMIVRNDLPAKTLAEFIALLKADPGKYNYGSSGNGTILHLSSALFCARAGVRMVHIPYGGAGPAMNDLLAGVIDMMVDNLPTAISHIRAGNVRALGITTKTRSPLLPDLPTISEQGLPDYETYSWSAFFAPAGTPPAILERLHKATAAAARDPKTRKRLNDIGVEVIGSTPQELRVFWERQIAFWKPIVEESGARIE